MTDQQGEKAPIVEEAAIILEQLGGRHFLMMTGAHNLFPAGVTEHNPRPWLRMDLHSNQANVNRLKITLIMDEYKMDFYHQELVNLTPVITNQQIFERVQGEDLARIFREVTGYETRLPVFLCIG
jgi:hypothetical protein